MDLKQLSYFVKIVEEGSISGAAKKLFMSQPPLSSQMKLLEAFHAEKKDLMDKLEKEKELSGERTDEIVAFAKQFAADYKEQV